MASEFDYEENKIDVICTSELLSSEASRCAAALGVALNTKSDMSRYQLLFSSAGVVLQLSSTPTQGPVQVDFCRGKEAHRRRFGGGKGQMIAKAVGVSSRFKPSVFDATAGLGSDAFVLASLGCEMTLMERSPVAYALLNDGLRRGIEYAQSNDQDLFDILNRMRLVAGNSIQYLESALAPVADVIYLDPMFPSRSKKAAVKKEMKAFHDVVGQDSDNDQLFKSAMNKAIYRVLVKRPRLAPVIADCKPSYNVEGKSSRYDIYTYKGVPR